ncbi:MAG: hypothetical protein PF448_12030 [Bacteroidales bacterium]|jgi:hypothetical protein|nr:hypothetical protein [Bacteroidales bacterium]
MNIEMVFKVLAPIGIGIVFLIALIGAFLFKRVSGDLKIIIVYFWSVSILELVSTFLTNNLVLMPIGSIIDLLLLTILYLQHMLVRGKYQFILVGLAGLGVIPIFFDFINALSGSLDYIFYGSMYASLIILIFSVIYFIQTALFSHVKINDKHMSINILIFVLYLLNLLFMLSINFLVTENVELVSYFWIIRLVIIIIINIGFGYLIWKHGRTPKTSQSA